MATPAGREPARIAVRLSTWGAILPLGLLTCLLSAFQESAKLWFDPEFAALSPAVLPILRGVALGILLAAYAVFFATFAWILGAFGRRPRSPRIAFFALLFEALAAAAISTDLFYLVSMSAAFALPRRGARIWIAGQVLASIALGLVVWRLGDFEPLEGLGMLTEGLRNGLTLAWVVTWQLLAFSVGSIAASERAARLDLEAASLDLRATERLLVESNRAAERLHIARELHDTLGHHLAALAVTLDLARRRHDGEHDSLAEPIREAHRLARHLLADVRVVVGDLRNAPPVDLAAALADLASSPDEPTVVLDLPEDLEVREPAVAHALFRLAQEALTNSRRHSGAPRVELTLRAFDDPLASFELVVRDDGRGADSVVPGHGLRGMRERVEALGGELEITGRAGHGGFEVRARLPARPPLST